MEKLKRPVGRPRTGKRRIIISIDPDLLREVDEWTAFSAKTRSEFIEFALRQALGEINK